MNDSKILDFLSQNRVLMERYQDYHKFVRDFINNFGSVFFVAAQAWWSQNVHAAVLGKAKDEKKADLH